MATFTLYINPACSKCRQALELLTAAGVTPRLVHYLETPLDVAQLEDLLDRLGLEPREVMRQGDELYRELGLEGRDLTRAEGLSLLAAHPRLLERPILVRDARAVVARPPARVRELLDP